MLPIPRAALVVILATAHAWADDWPQWLGPNRDGVWRETGIIKHFEPSGPRIVWRSPLAPGYSGPAVALGRVYVMDRRLGSGEMPATNAFTPGSSGGVERVLCLDAATGATLWKHEYACKYTVSYPAGPRVTPSVVDGRVYTLGAEGNLLCLEAATGAVVWAHDFKAELGVKAPMWGFAAHPLVEGDKVICLAAGKGSTAIAFDKSTGKELWRALAADEPGYAPPAIFEAGGVRQLIIWHPESVNSLDPQTGEVYWSVPFKVRSGLAVSTPRKLGDLLFLTAFYDGSLALRLEAAKPGATVAWQTPKGGNERNTTHLNSIICTPFLEDNLVYGVCSYGQLRCLDLRNGERRWETLKATTSGEPVRWANAFIVKNEDRYFLFNEKGDLIIARLTGAGYEEISRANLLSPVNKDPGRPVVWSHPAFANRRVYARNDNEMVCVDLAVGR